MPSDSQHEKGTKIVDREFLDLTNPDLVPTGLDVTNDDLQGLNESTGEEFAAEAARLGLVVTDRGLFADPDHAARHFVSASEAEDQLKDMFRRHGVEWAPESVDTIVAGS